MKELVAQRVPPGDRWVLLEEENDVVYGTLTDCLKPYLEMSDIYDNLVLDKYWWIDTDKHVHDHETTYEVKEEEFLDFAGNGI